MNKNNRIYKIIFLLMECKDYLTSNEIAIKLNVTERTIKSDISSVEAIVKNNGLQLISKKGKGYKLVVEDNIKMKQLKANLIFNLQVYPALSSEKSYKIIQILELILDAKQGIRFEDICDQLYLSKNSLHKEFMEAKKVINDFDLKLLTGKNGIALKGNELNIRLLTLKVSIFRQQTLYEDYLNSSKFISTQRDRKQIREVILKYLRQDVESINDAMINSVALYILISKYRIERGYGIILSQHQIDFAVKLPHLRLARKIYEDNELRIDNEHEILGLAIVLSMEAEISSFNIYTTNYSFLKDKIESFISSLYESIRYKFHVDFMSEFCIKVLALSSVPLFIKLQLGLTNVDFYFYEGEDKIYNIPFARILANFYEENFYSKFNIGFSNSEYWKCVCAFERIISSIEYPFTKPKVCVCSVRGYTDAYITAFDIKKYFSSYLETIDVKQLYELRTIRNDTYDWLILNGEEFVFRYDWKYLVVNRIPNQQDLINVYKYIFYSGVQIDKVVNKLFSFKFNYFNNYKIEGLRNFFNYLHYRFSLFDFSEIYSKRMYFTTLIRKTLFIWIKTENFSGLEIYELSEEENYNGQIINSLIIIDTNFDNDLVLFKLVNDLLYYITELEHRVEFEKVLETKDKAEFELFVKSVFLHL